MQSLTMVLVMTRQRLEITTPKRKRRNRMTAMASVPCMPVKKKRMMKMREMSQRRKSPRRKTKSIQIEFFRERQNFVCSD